MPKSSFTMDMPPPYYWEQLDNFFHKLTAMESPRKNNDCYFYYYSTCTKGDSCTFRHEPSALGCETMCSYWQQGKCLNQHCNFRHMELRKNRKAIPCYWETQPSGCRKPHCPFQHKNPREPINVVESPQVPAEGAHEQKNERADWNRRQVMENNQHVAELTNNEIECARPTARRMNQANNEAPPAPTYGTPAVDPLVVNFEEESDNESTITSTTTPIKDYTASEGKVGVKTLEEIRLEKIQQQSAALYNYVSEINPSMYPENAYNKLNYNVQYLGASSVYTKLNSPSFANFDTSLSPSAATSSSEMDSNEQDLRHRLLLSRNTKQEKKLNFEVLSLKEIRKRKKVKFNALEKVRSVLIQAKSELTKDSAVSSSDNSSNITSSKNIDEIKIKTLDEIRAERALKQKSTDSEILQNSNRKRLIPDEFSTCEQNSKIRKKSDNSTNCSGDTHENNNRYDVDSVCNKTVPDLVVEEELDKKNVPQNDNRIITDDDEKNSPTISDDSILKDIDELLND